MVNVNRKPSSKPGKQRKKIFEAKLHQKRRLVSSHLEGSLIKKYNVRSVTVRKGDTVTIMRGKWKGMSGKVVNVDHKNMKVIVEGITNKKADGKEVEQPLEASNLLITKLDLSDKKRKSKLERLGGKA